MSVVTVISDSVIPSIWQALERWSSTFADWQKLLLANAVRHGVISPAVIDQAYALFLSEFDLAQEPSPKPEIPTSITGRVRDGTTPRKLRRIHSLSGVNRLPSSSELTFSDGLTVVYGGNGVGKSGFARILSNACFSRQQHRIYPDIFNQNAPMSPSATIDLVSADGAVTPLSFNLSTEHAELKRGFVVFDSDVATRHLTDHGPLGFVPTGFDVFSEMARAYAAMQGKLAADIGRRSSANPLANAFIGAPTPASTASTALSRHTDLDRLKALASFGPDQAARIDQLQAQADGLRVRSPDSEIRRLEDARPQLLALKQQLSSARHLLNEDELAADVRLRQSLNSAARELARVSAAQFSHDKIAGIGSTAWEQMVSASQLLAEQQHNHYPHDGDPCLLCQQGLGADARTLYGRYAEFTRSDASASLSSAEQRIAQRRLRLAEISLSVANPGSIAHSFLAQSNPTVWAAILSGTKGLIDLRDAALAAFEGEELGVPALALADFDDVIDEVIRTIDGDLARLRQSDVPATLKIIEQDRVELRHREVLAKNLDNALKYVADQKWRATAEGHARPALNPRHLTEKQTELFGSVIAKNYRDKLAQECEGLACNVPVEFRTQGRQGQTIRSLAVGDRSPEDILSEGEQRAVALADFLTEISLNDDNVGIILDDPVTSLDHDRKDRIAVRLVAASKERQVVVFTHDMVFFAKLGDAAHKADVQMLSHWMQRSADNVPGTVSPNDGPTTTPQYRKTDFAEQTLAKAKAAVGSAQEALVRQGAGQLRRTVEEIVPQFLFKEVVRRWTDRVIVTALKKISWDNGLADDLVNVFEECSAIMEGHSHTEAGTEAPPTPAKLEDLITRTKDLIRRAKADRKS